MAAPAVLGQRAYAKFEDEEVEGHTASQSEVALHFEGGEATVEGVRKGDQSVPQLEEHQPSAKPGQPNGGSPGLRSAAKADGIDFTLGREIRGPSAENDNTKELMRLKSENKSLRDEVDHLKTVKKENAELKQVVTQLKNVVVSYGFSELDVMTAKPKKDKEGFEQLRYAPRELFIIITMKFAEISAYYGGAYIYTNYLTEEMGLTDQEAGNLYGAYGFISSIGGLPAGLVIDKLGVRKSLLVGTISSTIYRFWMAMTTSGTGAIITSLTFAPIGCSFGVPVLALAIRRYSHKDNRKFAFSIFYTMLMLATLLGTMSINQIRGFFPDGMDIMGKHYSWMRITWLLVVVFTLYTVVCAFLLRDIQVVDDRPLEDMIIEPAKTEKGDLSEVKRIIMTPRFARLTCVSLIFCGVQSGFRHLDATFPKYMMRTYGPNAPWEVILSVNPVVTFFLAPVFTALLIRYKVGFRKALVLGAILSGFSPFFLAAFESYLGAILWITIMSIGQAIWGPKLYEYSTMSAPTGREGLFVAITAAPIYLSSVPAGIMSGWLLEHYCPRNTGPEAKNGRMLWFVVGCSVVGSPILLWMFRKKLLKRGEDKPPEQATDQSIRVDLTDLTPQEEGKRPEVPSADVEEYDAPMTFGNAGAAWAGFDLGGSLSDDSDEDFKEEEQPPAQRVSSKSIGAPSSS